jgi:hypothetical protein
MDSAQAAGQAARSWGCEQREQEWKGTRLWSLEAEEREQMQTAPPGMQMQRMKILKKYKPHERIQAWLRFFVTSNL